jgi:hypothetical protein
MNLMIKYQNYVTLGEKMVVWYWRSWMGRGADILISQKLSYLETSAAMRPFPANGMKGHTRIKTRRGRKRKTCSEE